MIYVSIEYDLGKSLFFMLAGWLDVYYRGRYQLEFLLPALD
jgi:hypothetical protein